MPCIFAILFAVKKLGTIGFILKEFLLNSQNLVNDEIQNRLVTTSFTYLAVNALSTIAIENMLHY